MNIAICIVGLVVVVYLYACVKVSGNADKKMGKMWENDEGQ